MRVLTEQQVRRLAEIIERHMGVALYIGSGKSEPDPALLRKLGIPANAPSMIKNAFVLGKLIKVLEENDISKMTFDELKDKVKKAKLSAVEQNSLSFAEANAARYITALGQKISATVTGAVNQANQQALLEEIQRKKIKEKVSETITEQQTRGKLVSELGHYLEDWKRDWQRVAHTEIWNAKLQGEVISILQGEAIYSGAKGGDTLVFRRPSPDACNHCKRLYLYSNGIPKVFKLSELIANGTNVGKKTVDWKPITGTTHPNCTCPIAVLPDGFGFDANGELEYKGGS